MLGKWFHDSREYSTLVIRITLGVIMFRAGAGKLFGLFGGSGLEGTAGHFKGILPIPMVMAVLCGLGELVGGMLVMMGLITRYAALNLVVIMLVALFVGHGGRLFTDGMAAFVCLMMSVSLIFSGGGKASVDRMLKMDEKV